LKIPGEVTKIRKLNALFAPGSSFVDVLKNMLRLCREHKIFIIYQIFKIYALLCIEEVRSKTWESSKMQKPEHFIELKVDSLINPKQSSK